MQQLTRPAIREWCSGWRKNFKIEKGACRMEKEGATKESLKKES
jgi:sRNA-binding protein